MAYTAKTTEHDGDVEAFLSAVANEVRQADARELVTLMSDVTGEPPRMWGSSIIGFGSYHYRYASGHEGDTALISFAPRATSLVLYLNVDAHAHADDFAALGPYRAGKGCVYIKRLVDVDHDVLRRLIEAAVATRE
ncbi:MAG: hypothetical protein JWM90_275 [Thermoleophilia bacterium]|nr:hypothetical protein [Thermoleophilia bacterium]